MVSNIDICIIFGAVTSRKRTITKRRKSHESRFITYRCVDIRNLMWPWWTFTRDKPSIIRLVLAKGKVDSTSGDRKRTIAPWLCWTQNITQLQATLPASSLNKPPPLRHRSELSRLDSIPQLLRIVIPVHNRYLMHLLPIVF